MSSAFVAVTMQVPAAVTVSTPPLSAHPVAVPFTTTYVVAPVPEPPFVVRVSAAPYVPEIEVSESAS